MQETVQSNQATLKNTLRAVKALTMEKEYGCELSPYAAILLGNIEKLLTEQIERNSLQD